jgi:4-hydroxybenzoate polyprenyltransferase
VPDPRRPSRAALVSLRPRQWTKNLLLFAGLLFAAKLGDATRWIEGAAAFVAFCAASSAAYLVNDVRDAAYDRLHPTKSLRPIARGELAPRVALALAAVLVLLAVGLTAALGVSTLLYLAAFLGLQAAYTLALKEIVLLDVMTIAGLFVVRAAAGADAVRVPISVWLMVCTALLALFLGLAKRRGELVLVGAAATPGRRVLAGYSLKLVDRLVAVVAGSTVCAYALYTLYARDSRAMALTIPFVAFGVVRYLVLVHRDDLGEEPENVLLADRPILACVLGWAVCAAVILTVT